MTLCDRCQQIPLEDLPTLPDCWSSDWKRRQTDPNIINVKLDANQLRESSIFALYQSINALAPSRESCTLCTRIHAAIQRLGLQSEWAESAVRLAKPPRRRERFCVQSLRQGFVVYLGPRPGAGKYSIALLTSFGVTVNSDDPLASTFLGRPVRSNEDYGRTLDWAVNEAYRCAELHASCPRGETELPTRILELGDADSDPSTINLRESDGEKGVYVALSYCWGRQGGNYRTTSDQLEEIKAGIPVTRLPKTIQDAILVTRKLRIFKLWVDAMCIIQDDSDDWEREAARMAAVYSGAFLTIAANSAQDCQNGLYTTRLQSVPVEMAYTLRDSHVKGRLLLNEIDFPLDNPYLEMKMTEDPLSDRAWTFQERYLSRRVIHFCTNKAYIECDEAFLSEDGTSIRDRFMYLPRETFLKDHGLRKTYAMWYRMLGDYSIRQLTYSTDRLPAIAGIAQVFQKLIPGSEYVAGLWSGDLVSGMIWQPYRIPGLGTNPLSLDETSSVGPSWSWAYFNRGRAFQMLSFVAKPVAKILGYSVQLKSSLNPLGSVTGGWIKISVPVIPLLLDDGDTAESDDSDDFTRRPRVARTTEPGITIEDAHLDSSASDFPEPSPSLNESSISALLMAWYADFDEDLNTEPTIRALIVQCSRSSLESKTRRIGVCDVVGASRLIGNSAYLQTITLY